MWLVRTEICDMCKICTQFQKLGTKKVKYLNHFYIDYIEVRIFGICWIRGTMWPKLIVPISFHLNMDSGNF